MAKDYSERVKALDDIFQRLMVSSGITPEGSDIVTSYKGTNRQDWAFDKAGQNEGINVTPFQYRTPAEQKILGDMFEKLYGQGAAYETAGAHKNAADAMMASAGAAMAGHNAEIKRTNFLIKTLEEEKEAKKKAAAADGSTTPEWTEGLPPWAPKVDQPKAAAPSYVAPGQHSTTGFTRPQQNSGFDFSMDADKAKFFGYTPQQQMKKKKTGNLYFDFMNQ